MTGSGVSYSSLEGMRGYVFGPNIPFSVCLDHSRVDLCGSTGRQLGGSVEGLVAFQDQGKETNLGWGKACCRDRADPRQVVGSVLSLFSGSTQDFFSKEIWGKGGERKYQKELGERG